MGSRQESSFRTSDIPREIVSCGSITHTDKVAQSSLRPDLFYRLDDPREFPRLEDPSHMVFTRVAQLRIAMRMEDMLPDPYAQSCSHEHV